MKICDSQVANQPYAGKYIINLQVIALLVYAGPHCDLQVHLKELLTNTQHGVNRFRFQVYRVLNVLNLNL